MVVGGGTELITINSVNTTNYYDTNVPCKSILTVQIIARDYKYDSFFASVNDVLTWIDGINDTGGALHTQYFDIDTSGNTLKIKHNYGGNGIHDIYILVKK